MHLNIVLSRGLVCVLALFSIFSLACALPLFADSLRPFESDGCSSFPDGTYYDESLWYECCKAHDYAYWRGGTYDERVQADEDLRACVAELGQPEVAFIMLVGVRIGGVPWIPTEFRWGYGWSYPKAYGELTEGELALIKVLSEGLNGDLSGAIGAAKGASVREGRKTSNTASNGQSHQTQPLVAPGAHKVIPGNQ